MTVWGLLVETRIFGELLPFLACAAALIAEEQLIATLAKSSPATGSDDEEKPHLLQAA